MGTLKVLDKTQEADILPEGRPPAAPEEIANFLEEAGPPPPGTHQGATFWFYSVPLAGVRYYGLVGDPPPGAGTKRSQFDGIGSPPG
jgi:hypothetical protein